MDIIPVVLHDIRKSEPAIPVLPAPFRPAPGRYGVNCTSDRPVRKRTILEWALLSIQAGQPQSRIPHLKSHVLRRDQNRLTAILQDLVYQPAIVKPGYPAQE